MEKTESIKLEEIVPNPYQPRVFFDEQSIDELAASIRENGLIQQIVVRKNGDHFELVVGERRYRALRKLGVTHTDALVIEADDVKAASLALIENLQRSDLTPIEEATAYKQLLAMNEQTQEELAASLGRTQSSIANKIRLLNLSEDVQKALAGQQITERHGRAMLNLDEAQQKETLERILSRELTVKETENFIKDHYSPKLKKENSFIRCFGVSTQIAINTIRQACKSLVSLSVPVEVSENQDDEAYTMTITIKKSK